MNGRALSLADAEAVRDDHQLVRQWLVFPNHANCKVGLARLLTFRLLIEMSSGCLLFVEIKSRTAITSDVVSLIAASTENLNPYALHSRIVPELDDLGFQPRLLGDPIDDIEAGWLTQTLLAEAVLVNFMARSQRGEELSSGHRLEFAESIKSDLLLALTSFISALQAPVVSAILETGNQLAPPAYNYVIGSPDVVVLRNRLQAVRAFPILLHGLASGDGLRAIHLAIDGASKLLEALASTYGVPVSVVRLLGSLHVDIIGREWAMQIGVLLKFLASLQAHCRPRSVADWGKFNSTIHTILDTSGLPLCSSDTKIWLQAFFQRGYQAPDVHVLEREIQDAREFQSTLISALSFVFRSKKNFIRSHAYAAVAEFIDDIGITNFAKLRRRFDAALVLAQADYKDTAELLSHAAWPSVITEPFKAALRTVRCLTTPQSLDEEGQIMNHCVASYAAFCFSGDAQIWSVTDQDGQHWSTLHTTIVLNPKGRIVVNVVQHRGRSNVEPSVVCHSAVVALLHYMDSNQKLLADYLAWKTHTASLTKDQKARIILMRPIVAALEKILPKQWSLYKLVSTTEGYMRGLSSGKEHDA